MPDQRSLFDSDADLEEYLRRLRALPMFDERQISLNDLRYQRALTGLREEVLTRPRPWKFPGALDDLSGLSSQWAASPSRQPQLQPAGTGDFYSRVAGLPGSSNIEDRQPEFTWRNVANMLSGPRQGGF